MMEGLLYQCTNLNLNQSEHTAKWYNNSKYHLYSTYSVDHHEDCVYTTTTIVEGEFIGYITGEKKYTWDIPPSKYCIWLNDYYVIDCNPIPRCVTSIIRKSHDDVSHNCIMAFAYKDNSIEIYVIASKTILAGSELVIKPEYLDDY